MINRGFVWMRLLPDRWVLGLATLGPLGKLPLAPGTWGSLAGLVWYALIFHRLPLPAYLVLAGLTVMLAIPFCNEAENRLQRRDPGRVVLDEFVAIPVCFLYLQETVDEWGGWPVLLGGFLLFRIFDIWKPWPIRRVQDIPGGMGVVGDDVLAAIYTCLLLHLLTVILPLAAG